MEILVKEPKEVAAVDDMEPNGREPLILDDIEPTNQLGDNLYFFNHKSIIPMKHLNLVIFSFFYLIFTRLTFDHSLYALWFLTIL